MNKKVAGLHMLRQRLLPVKGPPPVAAGPSSYDSAGWAAAGEEISDDNLLWRQYILFVDLYRYYIDLVWKTSIWFFTTAGVCLAFFLAHLNSGNRGYLPLLLLFLGATGIGVSLIYSRVIKYVTQMEKWLEYIAVSLRLPGRPHVEFIRWFCQFVSGTLLIIAASCFGFFAYLKT
jgi:hypothetical protein